jgi:hypothetical protein
VLPVIEKLFFHTPLVSRAWLVVLAFLVGLSSLSSSKTTCSAFLFLSFLLASLIIFLFCTSLSVHLAPAIFLLSLNGTLLDGEVSKLSSKDMEIFLSVDKVRSGRTHLIKEDVVLYEIITTHQIPMVQHENLYVYITKTEGGYISLR